MSATDFKIHFTETAHLLLTQSERRLGSFFGNSHLAPLMQYTEKENEILDNYFPPRSTASRSLSGTGLTGDPEEEEWEWEGHEHDELIPWTFSSHDSISEEKFLVLYTAWNVWNDHTLDGEVLSFTSTDRLPPVEDSIAESYEYIVKLRNKLWRVSVNQNMGLEGVWCVQANLKHFKIDDIKIEVYGSYWNGTEIVE